jgi:osmotically-inducible protein OsmY
MVSIVDKSDTELKTDVLAELQYEPSVKVTDIGVLVQDGVVTLNGFATNYGEKWNAVRAAKRVAGVRAIADDIVIKMMDSQYRSDGDIAMAVANRMDWSTMVPKGAVEVSVRDGHVTLEGQLEWWYQKHAAENALEHLAGVKGLTNLITIKPNESASDINTAIYSAFERNYMLDARKIQVETSGNQVVLRGTVRNNDEREEAERVAWSAPGVYSVDNQVNVKWFWDNTD